MSQKVYTPDDYDRYGVLKAPLAFLPMILYLLKYPLLLTLPVMPNADYLAKLAQQQFDWGLLLSSLPPLLVLAAFIRRAPKGGPRIRWIWRHGRRLLLSAVIWELALLIVYSLIGRRQIDEVLLLFGYIDLMLLAYLLRSQRLRDMFTEFPAPPAPKPSITEETSP
jgi:hypothetical protein